MISLGDAVLKLKGDSKPLDADLKRAQGTVKSSMQKMQKAMLPVGLAFTALGAAGLAMVQSTKKINAALGVTALNLGVTTKEMRELTLATTNVTFPISEVTATFDLLARAGVKDVEVLKATATAFDTLGDATGRSASQVTQMMIPAMKTFGLTADEMAKKTDLMTYMSRKSTMTMEDFNTMVGYTTPELVKAGLTMEDLTAALIYMERQGYAPGRVMTREFMKATTLAAKEQIPLTEALGMTTEELRGLKKELEGATGMTQEYADVANEQYTIMDKLRQQWSELTLMASEYLEPLEPILAGMTALGPLMIGLSMVGIPRLIVAVKTLGHALKTLLLNPIVALIAALALLGYGIYALVQHYAKWDEVVEAATVLNEAQAKSEGKVTEEVLEKMRAYLQLREAYGQIAPEEEAYLERLTEIIQKVDDGTYVFNEITGALEIYQEELKETAEAMEELTEETDKAIDRQTELMDLIAKAAPKRTTMKQLQVIGEMMWAAERGITEVGGYAPGTVGFMRALGYPGYAGGGIISKPTLALLGEKGPEAVVPLDRMGRQMMTVIYEVDGRQMARIVMPYAIGEIRLRQGLKL